MTTAVKAQTLVYSDDFSTSSISTQGNPYLGGSYTPQLAFQQWTGSGLDTNISNNGLNVSSTSGIRTAGIVISPSLFDGAGDYTLTFDLTSYIGDSNDNALAEIWSGSGYNLTNNTSPDGLMVDTYSSSLKEFGNASAQLLADASLATASNGNQLGFTYDGSSAIAVFLGVKTDGWPFPSATFDNVSITTNFNVVPEPNAAMLLGIAGTCILLIRRRNS